MSASGHKQTLRDENFMSVFSSKVDKRSSTPNRIGLKTKRPVIEMAGRKSLRLSQRDLISSPR